MSKKILALSKTLAERNTQKNFREETKTKIVNAEIRNLKTRARALAAKMELVLLESSFLSLIGGFQLV